MAVTPRKLLSISHSYAVAMNRRLPREVHRAGAGRWEVTAVAPDYFHGAGDLRPVRFEPEANEGYRIEVVPAKLTRVVHLFYYGRKLRRIIREGWDLVHAWEEPYIHVGWQIARAVPQNTPLVYRSAQSISKKYPPPFNFFERYAMERAAGWICSGKLVEQCLKSRAMYRDKPMLRMPLGVDVDAFQPDRAAGDAVLRKLGWETDGAPVVGYLGRFVPAKGLDLLTSVLAGLKSPWRAMFVGAGPQEPMLREFQRAYPDRVRICTDVRHDAVPAYLNAMDIMCAPSQTTPTWREQFGRMLIEAFACGVCVVGSDSGEIPLVIGDAGIVCPERDAVAWSGALEILLRDPARRQELAQRGRERAQKLYAWPIIGRAYIEFFDRLLELRSSASR